MNLRQAAEQALEALQHWDTKEYYEQESIIRWEAMHALREALAEEALQRLTDVQQEIEAALAEPNKCTHGVTDGNCKECYMAEPDQEPLTDEEIEQAYRHIYHNVPDGSYRTTYYWIEQGIRYAEQAHGIKGGA